MPASAWKTDRTATGSSRARTKARKGNVVGWYGTGCGDVRVTRANLERMLADWERRDDPDAPSYCEGYWSPRPLSAFRGLERFEAWLASYDLEPTYDESGDLVALDLSDADKHPYRSPEDVLAALLAYAEVGSDFVEHVDEGDGGDIRHRLIQDERGKRWVVDGTEPVYGSPREMSAEVERLLTGALAHTGGVASDLVGDALRLVRQFRADNGWDASDSPI